MMNIYVDGKYSKEATNDLFDIEASQNSKLKRVKNPSNCEIYIAFDKIDKKVLKNFIKKKVFKVLVRNEPLIVIPQNYKARNTKLFDLVIDIGKQHNSKNIVLNWPQDLSTFHFNPTNRLGRMVVINSNLLSLKLGENYSLRRRAIKNIKELDLYGYQWNNSFKTKIGVILKEFRKSIFSLNSFYLNGLKYYMSNFENYLGPVSNKKATLAKYKYSLIIENSSDYVSEKLFDSLTAGCIPLYVGPRLTKFAIPTHLVFQAEPNLDSIKRQIMEAHKVDYQIWLDKLQAWLTDSKTQKSWSNIYFSKKLEDLILKHYQ